MKSMSMSRMSRVSVRPAEIARRPMMQPATKAMAIVAMPPKSEMRPP